MEKTATISNEDIRKLQIDIEEVKDKLSREIEGMKSTIEILQDKEIMEQIEESDKLIKEGAELEEFTY